MELSFSMNEENKKRIIEIEEAIARPDFWSDKANAQALIKELQDLKDAASGGGKYDKGDAMMTIFAGAGGDDAEDFAGMIFSMYQKFLSRKGLLTHLLSENRNDQGGYRNISFEIKGKNAYGMLKNESGVHRLVRISPFNAKSLRQTSFVLVEVIPKFEKSMNISIPDSEIKVEFAKSSGPGGQNVNKRETAVRVVHIPTKISVHADSERSQAQNKERALQILSSKLYAIMEQERKSRERGMYISKTTENEWGSQIRSYVLHPYKMVKDHRTNVETSNVDKILQVGDLDDFIEAEKDL